MKSNLNLTLFLFFAILILSCKQNDLSTQPSIVNYIEFEKKKVKESVTSGDDYKRITAFDTLGNIVSIKTFSGESLSTVKGSRNEYSYDKEGRKVKLLAFRDNALYYSELNEYDSIGNLFFVKKVSFKNNDRANAMIYERFYENDSLVMEKVYSENGKVLHSIEELFYNEKWQLEKTKYTNVKENSFVFESNFEYEQRGDSLVQNKFEYAYFVKKRYLKESKYFIDGLLVRKLNYGERKSGDADWEIRSLGEKRMFYDSKKKLTKKLTFLGRGKIRTETFIRNRYKEEVKRFENERLEFHGIKKFDIYGSVLKSDVFIDQGHCLARGKNSSEWKYEYY